MSADLIKQLLTALKTCSECAYRESVPGSGWSQWGHFDREKVAKAITAADAHLRTVPDTPTADLDRIATLERENAKLVQKVKRTRGSCNKLAKLLRDSERFIKDPGDKYAALAREHLLKAIDAALQPKEQTK